MNRDNHPENKIDQPLQRSDAKKTPLAQAKEARLKQALKQNLRRRKQKQTPSNSKQD